MKIFWSWQSDTPGKTGRHFVREALAEAVNHLKQPSEVEEPSERDWREAIHLDHDRKDVSGTPGIADVIFGKIDKTDIFIADVTAIASLSRLNPLQGETSEKTVINPNVAIEYGYAVKAVGDQFILLVQNTHYGSREGLPFDLQHKAGPIQYQLAPEASKPEREGEKRRLVASLVEAIRACMNTKACSGPAAPKFQEIPSTTTRAAFWEKGEIVARYGTHMPLSSLLKKREEDDIYEYRFDEPRALYLRVIPTTPRPEPFKFGDLMRMIETRRVRVMTRTINGGMPYKNRYGALYYETSGTDCTPTAMTQLHRNGEIWAVTRGFWVPYAGVEVVAMANVENLLRAGLKHFVEVARDLLQIALPYEVEAGVVGLTGMRLSLPQNRPLAGFINELSDSLHDDEVYIRRVFHNISPSTQDALVKGLLRQLWALVAVDV